ncbi:MAG TPA: hypothetical protein VEU47_13490 [Candidatus Cybelea sp.]|nr:hypothetical protein [Candidatus Cybelea sp.]
MTFNVRIFAYPGIVAAIQPQVVQQSADSVFMLRDPYLSGQKLVSNGAAEVASTPLPTGTKMLRVEVDDGNTIRYEIRMGANQRTASTNSPALSGRDIIFASDGAVFAFVDASAV